MQHLAEISRDFPFPFACLPQVSPPLPFLSPFVHSFCPSFSRRRFPPTGELYCCGQLPRYEITFVHNEA